MAILYVITGPAGVGKSTVSKLLAEHSKKSALIEGDDIYNQVVGNYAKPWEEGNHLSTFWKICISTIKTYLEDGYDVIYNYIVTPSDLELLQTVFSNYIMKFVVLLVDEQTLLKRDSNRPEDCRMNNRCITLLNNFKEHNYNQKYILDTSALSIEETTNIIENDEKFII